jgi:Na+-driven multidrug efflux pump
MVTNPLWAGYADAAARKDSKYIRQTLKTSMVLSFSIALIGAVIVLAFHRWLIAQWTSNSVEVPVFLAMGYAAWSVLDATGNAFAMFLNGLGILRPQLIVVLLFCLVAIPLKIVLVSQIGVVGIILATLISYVLTVALPYITFLRPVWTIRLRT